MKYHHIGIPTTEEFDGEIELPELKITVSDHEDNAFGIQWMRYWTTLLTPKSSRGSPHRVRGGRSGRRTDWPEESSSHRTAPVRA